jgi:ArsR family metal-binding transcriptional regulator
MLLKDYTFEIILPPCNPNAETVNAVARLSDDISPVLPYLNAVEKGAIYNPNRPSLSFSHEGKRIVLTPHEIAVTKLRDRAEAEALLAWVQGTINRVWAQRDTIVPSEESRAQLKLLDVYQHLPRTNCRACGQATCLAFAARIVAEEADLAECTPLFSGDYEANREALTDALLATGFAVSSQWGGGTEESHEEKQ